MARQYLYSRYPIAEDAVSSIHIWAVRGGCAHFARIAILQPTFSLSTSIVRTLADLTGAEEFGISMVFPRMMPLTLRMHPIDFVVLTAAQER